MVEFVLSVLPSRLMLAAFRDASRIQIYLWEKPKKKNDRSFIKRDWKSLTDSSD